MFPSLLGTVEAGLAGEGAFGGTASSDQTLGTAEDQEQFLSEVACWVNSQVTPCLSVGCNKTWAPQTHNRAGCRALPNRISSPNAVGRHSASRMGQGH